MITNKNTVNDITLVEASLKESLKKEHGEKLTSLLLPLDDINSKSIEVLAVIPSRKVIGQAMRFMQSNPIKGQEILVKNCLLTNKEEVLNDDALFFACAGLLSELMPIREGKFGKV